MHQLCLFQPYLFQIALFFLFYNQYFFIKFQIQLFLKDGKNRLNLIKLFLDFCILSAFLKYFSLNYCFHLKYHFKIYCGKILHLPFGDFKHFLSKV